MAIEVTNEFVKSYTQQKNKRHAAYEKTVEIYNHLRFHVDGYQHDDKKTSGENPFFDKLIGQYRPGETKKIQEFRKKIYTSVSREPCFKVINSLKKIIKSEEWQISYKHSESPTSIRDDETLQVYAEKKYPKRLKSIESWFYQFALRGLLTDPNALIFTIPLYQSSDTDYIRPFSNIANSDHVYDYVSDYLAVILSKEQSQYNANGKLYTDGKILYIFQPGTIHKATQINFEGDFSIETITENEGMPMQAYRAGFGEVVDVIGNEQVYESFISPMLPYLDKLARENSDLDAVSVRHMYPKEWEFSTTECSRCKGVGEIAFPGGNVTCSDCGGSGASASPFGKMILKNAFGENPVPTPPAGIVQRDSGIIELQIRRVKEHAINALATLNMEFLAETPINQSGVAKEVDRDELNNFVFGVAQNLIDIQFKNVYRQNAQQRYWRVTSGSEETIEEMLPFIPVPTKYDLLSENTVTDKLKKMSDSGVDPTIVSETQIDLAKKIFHQDTETKKKLLLIFKVNPFTGVTSDQINDGVLSGLTVKRDAVLSKYCEFFVKKGMSEYDDFLDKNYEDQLEIINGYLDAKMSELTSVQTPIINPDGSGQQ